MVFAGIIVAVIAAFILGVVVHAFVRGRKTGETVAEELRRMGFDIFFGFLTSRVGGAIARSLTARRA
jgi:fructose-specific phosphotransferase system IIC component